MKNKFKTFKVYVNGVSKDLQLHLFKLGYTWTIGNISAIKLDEPFLFCSEDGIISSGVSMTRFSDHPNKELKCAEIFEFTPESVIITPEPTFDPFEKVLCRNLDCHEWVPNFYSHKNNTGEGHFCIGGLWAKCIPYVGNEHLVGAKNETNNNDLVNKKGYNPDNLKPYDKVLCRQLYKDDWYIDFFSHINPSDGSFICIGGKSLICKPYAGNEHLMDPKKQPRNEKQIG